MKKILMIHISGNGDSEYNLGNFSFMIAKEIEKLNGVPSPSVFSFDGVVTDFQKFFKEKEGIDISFEKMKRIIDVFENEENLKSRYCAQKIKKRLQDSDESIIILYGEGNADKIKDLLNGEYAVSVKRIEVKNPDTSKSKVLFHVRNGIKALRKEPKRFKKPTL